MSRVQALNWQGMRRLLLILGLLSVTSGSTYAQWDVENSGSTADLRGIDSVGGGVAWASGTNGTVLRTEDGGYLWQNCTIPPGAGHLDFRGIQAFDANTAIVMSSGKGDLSRLYKTTDGCQTWKLVFTNPDKDGFWDALLLNRFDKDGDLLGDPVNGRFALWETADKGDTWTRTEARGLDALKDEGAFAASNSALFLDERFAIGFVTGGETGARVFVAENMGFIARTLPMRSGSQSTGEFSIDDRDWRCWVAVGGDYTKPHDSAGTAVYTHNGGKTWHAAQTPPHGFRSAVAYDADARTWITVGPNGTDISTDDGRNWRALHPEASLHEAPDADRNWNALSLPFVVGPHGRIGKLNSGALLPHALLP
jgi:photosystem II stability/assembly factor-like uncharacterized protein